MSRIRSSLTLARIFALILSGIAQELFYRLRLGPRWFMQQRGRDAIQAWMKKLLRIMRIRVETFGQPPADTVLLVSNHMTWLDIIVLSSTYPYSFLSKSEVRSWPLIGALSAMSGTLFIRRADVRSLKTSIRTIRKRLEEGRSVSMFPEGTTRAVGLNPFKTGLFAAAIEAQVKVKPAVIRYMRDGSPDHSVAYVDDDNFMVNLAKQAGKTGLVVELHFLPELVPNCDRRELAMLAHTAISECQQHIYSNKNDNCYSLFLEQITRKKIA